MKHVLFFIALLSAFRLSAGLEPVLVQSLPGGIFVPYPANTNINPSIIPNKILTPAPFVVGSTSWGSSFTLKSVNNLVKLYSDQNSAAIVNFDYQLTIPVIIKYYKNGNPTPITLPSEKLTINYHPDPNVQREYQQTDAFRFADGCQVEVTVQTSGIVGKRLVSGAPLSPAEMEQVSKTVWLQSEIEVERYYNFNPATILCPADITLTPSTTDNSLEVRWRTTVSPNVPLGAEEWDIEWLYVDDYQGLSGATITYNPANALNYNFNQNAARVQVRGDTYRIPLVYEHGYLLIRVRPVGRSLADNFTSPVPALWSCGFSACPSGCNSSSGIVANYQNRYFINTAHENDRKNWQAVTTYAEAGKRKDVVSYYDGTMRNRQSVTGLSTEKMTLVGETFYDHQGRAAVQALPAPINDATLKYYTNFNQNDCGTPYNRRNFDIDNPDCASGIPACSNMAAPMKPDNSGASRYYSPFNPDLGGFNAFIPNAEKYPFTRTEYTPDNTGRIARQGGVGLTHQLGKDHETKYFYGVPHQEELDQLFGSEAGHAIYYKKNMVMDPNGQISLSYLDAKGNTIATALAGNPPPNMLALPSYIKAQVTVTVDLLAHNQKDEANFALVMQETELVNTQSNYVFDYSVKPTALAYTDCDATAYCLDCIYDLEFKIVDNLNCGDIIYQNTQSIGQLFDAGGAISLKCSGTPTTLTIPSFTVNLKPGSYTFTKRLSVNEAAADAYVAAVLDTCPTLYKQILQTQYAEMDTTGCEVDCADVTADKNNTTYWNSLSTTGKDSLNALISDLCDSLALSSCEVAMAAMLEDVSPGGQYGYIPSATATDATEMAVSVYSTGNILGLKSSGPPPNYHYMNNSVVLLNADGSTYVKTTPENIQIDWRPEWAEKLVQYHPEYCYYDFCKTYISPVSPTPANSSDRYNAKMMNTETYADAVTAGFIANPMTNDPFFNPVKASFNTWLNLAGVPGAYNSLMTAAITANYKGSGLKMDELAIKAAIYPATGPLTWSGISAAQRDKAWIIYRSLYLTYKEELYYKIRTGYAIQNNCYNECIGDSDFNPFLNNFWNNNGFLQLSPIKINTDQINCDLAGYHFFKNKAKRFPSVYDIFPDNFPFDFFATPQKQAFDWIFSQYNDQKQQVCCDSLYTQLPQFLYAVYSAGQNGFTLSATANNNIPDEIEAVLLGGATQMQGTVTQAAGAYSINFQPQNGQTPPCRQLQFKFVTPPAGTVTNFCCYQEIATGTIFTGLGIHFRMTAILSSGNSVQIEGIFSQECPFECPPAPIFCPDSLDQSELQVLFNYLIYQDKFRAGTVVIPPAYVGTGITTVFGSNTGNFTWNAPAGSSANFSATLTRGNKTCTFNFTQSAGFNWLQVDKALPLQAQINTMSGQGHVNNFTVPLQMSTGGTTFMPGSSPCFVLKKCCLPNQEKPCTNCPTIAKSPERGTILAQINATDCDPPCDPKEGFSIPISNPCVEQMIAIAQHNAQEIYDNLMDSMRNDLKRKYMLACLGAVETHTVTYKDARHHFTLYYYDQANNLVETVPPAGIVPLSTAQMTQVANVRKGLLGTPVYATHKMVSRYAYNTLNQLRWQQIPDHTGPTRFWYDPLGRLIASQNAKQTPNNQYSYTKYDALGRIVEVGQIKRPTTPPAPNTPSFNTAWATWLNTPDRDQITNTWYDRVALTTAPALFPNGQQENLRGRVVSISYNGVPPGGLLTLTNWIHYSYDIHGNVKTMVQDNLGLGPKKVEYEYDLVSGNVNALAFQRNQPDQILHRYAYDADNRLIEVRTSLDGVLWDKEAAYKYYKHGPLARVELGDDRVQGFDYAYTLHGWIKGMNSGALQPQRDMGKDGQNILPGHFARDAAGYLLGYFDGEYKPVGAGVGFEPGYSGSNLAAPGMAPSLYNGNIRHMVTAIKPFMGNQKPLASMYRYDQLNRLISAGYDGTNFDPSSNVWVAGSVDVTYKNSYNYDPNGNIMNLSRNGNKTGAQLLMDKQTFNYQAGTNKLTRVLDDPLLTGNYTEDIDDQSSAPLAGNYQYDGIGNLEKDLAEKLTYKWNLQGKVSQIDDTDAPAKTIQFGYDPLGNRYFKGINNQSATLYAYDASGNVLATYRASAAGLFFESGMFYGSKRLGEYRADICLGSGCVPPATLVGHYYRYRGKRRYEESNHLGNVLATVSDRKLPVAGTAMSAIVYYETFDAGLAGWFPNANGVLSNSGGKLKVSGSATNDGAQVKLPVTPGLSYTLNFDLNYGTSAGTLWVTLLQKVGGTYVNTPLTFAPGTNTHTFSAASESYLNITFSAAGNKFFLLDNLALTTGGFSAGTLAAYFDADVVSAQDYYPFGMAMVGRTMGAAGRYGFNGQERVDEISGSGNHNTAMYWEYDTRLGQRQNLDPESFAFISDFSCFLNNPILLTDQYGNTVDPTALSEVDKQKLKSDLEQKTGYTLIETETELGDKRWEIDQTKNVITNGTSRAARRELRRAINSEDNILLISSDEIQIAETTGNRVSFNFKDIETVMKDAGNGGLNPSTVGYALTFFHEIRHTKAFAMYNGGNTMGDPELKKWQPTKSMVDIYTNRIRKQLGEDYGKRQHYYGRVLETSESIANGSKFAYLAMDKKSLIEIKKGNVPTGKFVKFDLNKLTKD